MFARHDWPVNSNEEKPFGFTLTSMEKNEKKKEHPPHDTGAMHVGQGVGQLRHEMADAGGRQRLPIHLPLLDELTGTGWKMGTPTLAAVGGRSEDYSWRVCALSGFP